DDADCGLYGSSRRKVSGNPNGRGDNKKGRGDQNFDAPALNPPKDQELPRIYRNANLRVLPRQDQIGRVTAWLSPDLKHLDQSGSRFGRHRGAPDLLVGYRLVLIFDAPLVGGAVQDDLPLLLVRNG